MATVDARGYVLSTGMYAPQCGGILFKKKGKKPKLYCATEGCGFEKEFVEKDGE